MNVERVRLYGRAESRAKAEGAVGRRGVLFDRICLLRASAGVAPRGISRLAAVERDQYGFRYVRGDGERFGYFYDLEGLCEGEGGANGV